VILDSRSFWTAGMTFKVIQGHRKRRGSIENMFLNTKCDPVSHRFRDYYA